jgi:hypothetical protein
LGNGRNPAVNFVLSGSAAITLTRAGRVSRAFAVRLAEKRV